MQELVAVESQLVNTPIIGQDVNHPEMDLVICNGELGNAQESVVYDFQQLRFERVEHEEYFRIGLVLMLHADTISQQETVEVGNVRKRILDDLDLST